jgi:hypothetical protein
LKTISSFIRTIALQVSDSTIFYHGSPYNFNKFDMNKVGSGDGLSKYGYGLYFANNKELAEYYATELSIGSLKETGMIIYEVRLRELDDFVEWEAPTPDNVYQNVIKKLDSKGKHKDAQEIRDDLESYGDAWSIKSLYGFLKVVLGSDKLTTDFLYDCGLSGTIAEDIHGRGKIYVAYSDSIINIIHKSKVGEEDK